MTEEIRRLTVPEIKWLYKEGMKGSFPEGEIKKYAHVRKGVKDGSYYGYGLYLDGRLSGYALISRAENVGLLDYLAVDKSLRGKGYGQKIMAYLSENEIPLIIEADDPDKAFDDKEKTVRLNRIHFYIDRCKCIDSGVKASVAGFPFVLLSTGRKVTAQDYLDVYRAMVPQFIMKNLVKV